MAVFKESIFGNNNVGVYLAMNNHYFIYPPQTKETIIEDIPKIHEDLIPIELTINGGSTLGSYIAINSNGMIVPSIINDNEMNDLQKNIHKNFSITVLEAGDNAFGNLILCNDTGAIISSKMVDYCEVIQDTLKLKRIEVLDFADSELPGSSGVCNNKGVVVHPMIIEEHAEIIADVLGVNIDVSTINCGNPFLSGGIVANDFGAIFGKESTGPELQRVMEILEIN